MGGPDGMTTYSWIGPNGFTSNLQSPPISDIATLDMRIDYALTINGVSTATTIVVITGNVIAEL